MRFTVFTPTYNRAHTLHRVYDSLVRQTWRDFEWLVVDDGSTDDTRELVAGWVTEGAFPIRYLHQTNRGKHVAYNVAVREARGDWILPLDSDDACLPNALERLAWHWDQIPEAARAGFSAVTGLCQDPSGTIIGDRFPNDVTDSNTLEMRYRYRVRGEKWGFQRREVLREFPFPELEGATHCPENVVWTAIAQRYQTRYVNEVLRVYYPAEGAGGQLTQARPARVAVAGVFEHETVLNEHLDWFGQAPLSFLRSAVHYVRFSLHRRRGVVEQWSRLRQPLAKLLWIAALLPGACLYWRERKDES